ncbi:hypothetical protein [Vibrio algarum]|uniref:Twin-arginine translocation signal domain-containing protein n=1 Tax=Vibrio algarum TaxID=3020714 RepID=A0ABT4YPD0_9VIBR|nr:hypothetical protein [Vibrio sp. KJ40-1]MDB1123413.1 hypothetical protein [Vibrio sp. KJ40-1]
MKSIKQDDHSVNPPLSVEDATETKSSLSRRDFGKFAAGLGLASVVGSSNAFAQDKPLSADKDNQPSVTPEGYEGNIAVCTVLIVKQEMEKETDDVWDRHKKWLKETHGPWGMVSYTVAKHKELKYPLKPENGETTDRIVYVIHEVYRHLEGLKKHYAECMDGNYLEDFIRICTAEGNTFTVLQGAPITHSLLPKDCDFPITFAS